MDHLTIETPEQIPLEFLLAGIGSRFLALALDTLIQTAVTVLLIVAGLVVASGAGSKPSGGVPAGSQTWTLALLLLIFFLVQFGYFAFFEGIWNGQTPGKRYMHLRVIKDSGRPITTFDALGRNLLRLVDSLPGIYAVAIVFVLLSRKNKRLGDYVAGTVVVHERPLSAQVDINWETAPRAARASPPGAVLKLTPPQPPLQPDAGPQAASGYDAGRLSAEEFHLMETFLLRRRHLAPEVRLQMARQIVERISTKLGVSEDDQSRAERLVERLANEYRRRAHVR